MNIWFASGNTHKKAELAAILRQPLLIPADAAACAGLNFDPEESGTTFYENALIKARELYSLLEKNRPSPFTPGDIIIADDSGICVDALGGKPGVFSARYAGAGRLTTCGLSEKKLESSERNALLLDELGDNPVRTARFVCAMALMVSPNRFFVAQETFEGEIVAGPEAIKGTGGFGYDPIFYIPELGRTAAELSETEKNTISHRAKAGKIIAAMLNCANAKDLPLIAKT